MGYEALRKKNTAMLFKVLYVTFTFLEIFLLLVTYEDGMTISSQTCLNLATLQVVAGCVYCAYDFEKRMLFGCFNLTYMLFLLSGLWASLLSGSTMGSYMGAPATAIPHTCYLLAISLAVVNLAYVLFDFERKPKEQSLQRRWKTKEAAPLQEGTKQVILIAFIVTLVAKMAAAVIEYRFLENNTYVESYVMTYSKPLYVALPESIFFICLCLWLATNPPKKQFLILIFFVFIAEGITMMAGSRSKAMVAILMVFFYMYRRSKRDKTFIQFTKTRMCVLLLLVPLLMMLLQSIKYTRANEEVDEDVDLISAFFLDQGVSVNIIANGYVYEDAMRQVGGSSFSLGPLWGSFVQNRVGRVLFGVEEIRQNTVEAAYSGISYGATMAYLMIPVSYLSGVGCGSSYIAELYHDGGMLLLVLGSILLALLLLTVSRFKPKSIYGYAFIMLLFKGLLYVPRSNSTSWLTSSFSVQNIMVVLVIIVANQLFSWHNTRKEPSA